MADVSPRALSGFLLRLQSEVRLFQDGADVTPTSRKGRALLAILAIEGEPVSRIRLIDLLWSNREEEQARASLRTLLADLKHHFGEDFPQVLSVERDRIGLGPALATDLDTPLVNGHHREPLAGLDHLDPVLDDWLREERARLTAPPVMDVAGPHSRAAPASPRRWMTVALLVAILAALAIFASTRSKAPAKPLLVALLPDPTGSVIGELIDARLRDELSAIPGVRVLGEHTSGLAADRSLQPVDLKRQFGVERVYSATVRSDGRTVRYIGRLFDASTGAELWSSVLPIEERNARSRKAALDDLSSRLRESLDIAPPTSFKPAWYSGPAADKLASARLLLARDKPADALAARGQLLQAVALEPDNVPVLAALAEATMAASDHVYSGGTIPLADARAEALAFANRAIRLAPEDAAGYAALGASHMELAQAIAPYSRAVALEPADAGHRMRLGRALEFADRYAEALEHQRVAARLDPLSPQPMIGLVRAANQLERHDLIRAAIADFAGRAATQPDDVGYVRAYYAFLRDDNVGCIRNFGTGSAARADRRQRNILLFCLAALGERTKARTLVADEDSLRSDVLAGDIDVLAERVRRLGPTFWQLHYDALAASELLVREGRHQLIVELFDQAYNSVAEFEREGGFQTLYPQPLIVAFRNAGRTDEARLLRDLLLRNMRKIQTRDGPDFWDNFHGASIAMADGQADRAITLLERCYPTCIFAVLQRDISETAMFRPLVGNPRFDALIRRYRQMINRQRRSLALAPLPLA